MREFGRIAASSLSEQPSSDGELDATAQPGAGARPTLLDAMRKSESGACGPVLIGAMITRPPGALPVVEPKCTGEKFLEMVAVGPDSFRRHGLAERSRKASNRPSGALSVPSGLKTPSITRTRPSAEELRRAPPAKDLVAAYRAAQAQPIGWRNPRLACPARDQKRMRTSRARRSAVSPRKVEGLSQRARTSESPPSSSATPGLESRG